MKDDQPQFHMAGVEYVFLDRDGVINRKLPEGAYVTRWDELELISGAASAIARLNRSGRKVIVVTNQRGVALGLMTETQLQEIHEHLRKGLAEQGAVLDAIYYCPHDRDACGCRKPQTGMIEAAFQDFPDAGPESSVLIGDSLPDIECGHRAGIRTIFVEGECGAERQRQKPGAGTARSLADDVAASLDDAVSRILG